MLVEDPYEPRGHHCVTLNAATGPLVWLRQRRDKDGAPLISDAQFKAGQRFASELQRGALVPGLGNSFAGLGIKVDVSTGHENGSEQITDSVIQARRSVEDATKFLGKDLAAVAVDVCLMEQKLADVERKHGWPVRSAKVVLTIALERLAFHYGYVSRLGGADC